MNSQSGLPFIIPIWQPQGFSTHIIAAKVAEKLDVKTSHTGTLDPMAQGVVIVLAGEDRLNKYEYATWQKTYEFEIALGISTDTYDGLGLITATESVQEVVTKELTQVLEEFTGSYQQEVPLYSAIKLQGRHLFEYADRPETIIKPRRNGEIYSISCLDIQKISTNMMINTIINKIKNVTGDFRQKEIIDNWTKFLQNNSFEVPLLKINVTLSKGLYVRSLSQDICKKLNVPGFVYSLVRTKNGIYFADNSYSLSEYFGMDFQQKYNFSSEKKKKT